MKCQVENLNKLERETFESFGEKGYGRVIRDIVVGLDEFGESEAIAILESAQALIALRRAWRGRNQLIKQNRGEQVSREISDRPVG